MVSLHFDRTFRAQPGEIVEIAPGIRRITAPNPGAMTFTGTNSYLIGTDPVAIIDPGPVNAAHLAALTNAIGGARLEAILVSHTHRDHSPLARTLHDRTGAPIIGAGPHLPAAAQSAGEQVAHEAADLDYAPHRVLADGARLVVGGNSVEVVATPGHTMNHLCFALTGTPYLFSGDHVMAWSTTLVAPPDGAMTPYLESLQKLIARPEAVYLPGHGAWLADARVYTEALYAHRMSRETAILNALECDALTVPALVDRLYEGLDSRLRGAAALSVLAHLERLETLGQSRRIGTGETLWTAQGPAFDSAS